MEIKFTVESTNGKVWTAVCADPVLEVEATDIVSACKAMAAKIEKWFIDTFNTKKNVIVTVPVIKATVKASVSVRAETPLDEFPVAEKLVPVVALNEELVACSVCGADILVKIGGERLCKACDYDRSVNAKSGEIDDELTERKRPALPMPPSLQKELNKVDGPCAYISDGKGIAPVGACEAVSHDPSDTPGIRVDGDGTCAGEYEKCTYYKAGGTRMSDVSSSEDSYDADEIDEYGAPMDTSE